MRAQAAERVLWKNEGPFARARRKWLASGLRPLSATLPGPCKLLMLLPACVSSVCACAYICIKRKKMPSTLQRCNCQQAMKSRSQKGSWGGGRRGKAQQTANCHMSCQLGSNKKGVLSPVSHQQRGVLVTYLVIKSLKDIWELDKYFKAFNLSQKFLGVINKFF